MQDECDGRPTEHARGELQTYHWAPHRKQTLAVATHEAHCLCDRRTPEATPNDISTQGKVLSWGHIFMANSSLSF